jgi:proline iminopeptidase
LVSAWFSSNVRRHRYVDRRHPLRCSSRLGTAEQSGDKPGSGNVKRQDFVTFTFPAVQFPVGKFLDLAALPQHDVVISGRWDHADMRTSALTWADRTEGFLDLGDDRRMWWCELGDPAGIPLVVVHGGPGGGTVPAMAAPYDLGVYRVIMFDQRGCGRSLPHASDPAVPLADNTTDRLVADMELLREDRGIDTWIVSGSSWGTTLGLAYVCEHPDRVRAVLLRSITTYGDAELGWVYRDGASRLLPEAWEEFEGALADTPAADTPAADTPAADTPAADTPAADDLVATYRRALEGTDDARRLTAALAWCRWELAGMRAEPGSEVEAIFTDPVFATGFARISTHYAAHRGFLDHDRLWASVPGLGHIPATFVQGRYDLCTPPATAWRLHRQWPGSVLHLLDDEGHRLTGAAAVLRRTLEDYARLT